MDLASLGIQRIEVFILVLVRTAGIFTLVPLFGSSQVPVQVRIAISIGLSLVFVPMCMVSSPTVLAVDVFPMALLIFKEAFIGIVIGFVTILIFAAIQNAGDLIDMNAGFSFAAMLDPVNGSQTAISGRLHHMLAGLLFFATNAHYILLSGLSDSFRLIPVGEISLHASVSNGVFSLFAALFAVALRIAAPVIVAVFLADVALGVIARVVPQMNVMISGFPIKLGVGIAGMIIALPVAVAMTRSTLADIYPSTMDVLRALAGY